MLSGDNGLLKRAGDARDDTVVGQEKEQVELAYISAAVKKLGDKVDKDDLQTELNSSVGSGKTNVSPNGDTILNVNFIDTKHNYKVDNGTVTRVADGEVEDVSDDIFVALYNDGTLVFSNNQEQFDISKVIKSYGNIKDDEAYSGQRWIDDQETISKVNIINKLYPKNMNEWFIGLNVSYIEGISNIDTSSCTDLSGLFYDCMNLQRIDLSGFDTSNVTSMANMFHECRQLTNINFGNNFNTQNVTQMNGMFNNCYALTTLDLSSFDTSKVEDISDMFSGCRDLVTIYGNNWNTSSVVVETSELFGEIGKDIFNECSSLIGGNGTTYDSNHIDYSYARIDGGTSNPGYFTSKTN